MQTGFDILIEIEIIATAFQIKTMSIWIEIDIVLQSNKSTDSNVSLGFYRVEFVFNC